MSGTHKGGIKARDTILAKNPNHYKEAGAIGGSRSTTGGFAANPKLARVAASKGGKRSRRGYTFIESKNGWWYYTDKKTGESMRIRANQTKSRKA